MTKETLELTNKELDRLKLIHEVTQGHMKGVDAARILGISYRQFKRLKKDCAEQGDRALMHGLRKRASNRRIADETRQEAISLVRENYHDFGPTLAAEMLRERNGIKLSKETVRKLMIEDGLRKAKKKKEHHRKKRERRPCFGELVQIDGSHHDWFEGRSERACLMVMVDDATSETLAFFSSAEDTKSAMTVLKMWIEKYGRPRAIYADRHAIWIAQKGDKGEKDDFETTQLARALRELDIDFIPARSPQAKGRVERSNGTLQDRLVKEMRLDGVAGTENGNEYLSTYFLPKYNGKFRKKPASKADVHRKLGRELKLSHILSEREERTVQNDYTIRWKTRTFQIEKPAYPGLRGGKVEVGVHLDGTWHLTFKGRELNWHEVNIFTDASTMRHTTPRGGMEGTVTSPKPLAKPSKPWVPPPDHPWRRPFLKTH
jgi:transposase